MANRRSRAKAAPTASAPESPLAVLGDVGLKISGGTIQEEYVRGLQGTKARDAWQEMLDSPLPGAVMSLISMLSKQVEWRVCPAIEDETDPGYEEAKRHAEFVEDAIQHMDKPWNQIVDEALSAYPFGFSLAEPVFEVRRPEDGGAPRVMLKDIEPRAQSSVMLWNEVRDEHNRYKIVSITQNTLRGTFTVPLDRLIHFVPRPEKRSPEGRSAFRSGWRAWLYARNLEEDESIGIGRDLTGIPDIQLPLSIMSASAGTREAAIRADWEDKARKLRRGKLDSLVRPAEEQDGKKTGYAAKLMTSGGQQRVQPDTPIRRHETRFLISVLCDFMTLGTEAVGSRALADPKINLTVLAIGGLLDGYADAVNKQLVPRLCDLNGIPKEMRPEIERGEVMAPQLPELIDLLSKAINGGIVVPNQQIQDWVTRQIPGAPEPEEISPVEPQDGLAPTASPTEPPGQTSSQTEQGSATTRRSGQPPEAPEA